MPYLKRPIVEGTQNDTAAHDSAKSMRHGAPLPVLATLMLALFSVSLGYGAMLPMLPERIMQALTVEENSTALAQTTGILAGVYTFALFIFAPLWGWISDRLGRRRVLLVGLGGFGVTMIAFSSVRGSEVALYAERLLSGLFAAAVTPVALAIVADLAASDVERARRQTLVSLSGTMGFLVGPTAAAILAQSSADFPRAGALSALSLPLVATGVLALGAWFAGLLLVPWTRSVGEKHGPDIENARPLLVWRLLALSFVVAVAVGVFEVGLVLRGQGTLKLGPYEIAMMFSECSLLMFLVQAVVFSPLLKPQNTRWLIMPSLVILAVSLFLLPRTSDYVMMVILVGAIASSAGVLSPIATYWISSIAGARQGARLGQQTAAASLGATLGSIAGGTLFDFAGSENMSFVAAAITVLAMTLPALALPSQLAPRADRPRV
jgi:MFS family permease